MDVSEGALAEARRKDPQAVGVEILGRIFLPPSGRSSFEAKALQQGA